MLSPAFATRVIGSSPTAEDTLVLVSSAPVRVIGFTASRMGLAASFTVIIASADGSVVYDIIRFSAVGVSPTHYISNHPWIADKGLSFKGSGTGSTGCFVAFYIEQIGS